MEANPLIALVARTASRDELLALLDQHHAEVVRLRKREAILVDAMAEVKATNDGTSTQPISRIVAGCIAELADVGGADVSALPRPIVLALCECSRIVPRPNQLYRYEVRPGCKACEELAAPYDRRHS